MIPHFGSHPSPGHVAEALEQVGVVLVSSHLSSEVQGRLEAELRPHLAACEPEDSATLSALFARSFTLGDMILDPLLLEVVQHALGTHCRSVQVSAASFTRAGPGTTGSALLRDGDAYAPYFGHDPSRHPTGVACTWMLADAADRDGAPRFVLGSHAWPASRVPAEEEIVAAEAPRGALAIHTSGTLHGAGANDGSRSFASVQVRFTLGWLRQEENQYLSIPADRLERFPERVRALLGWQPQGPSLGWAGGHDLARPGLPRPRPR